MYDFENYTLESMFIKGRDDAYLYKGNASESMINYLKYTTSPGLIKAKISNYIMGYKLGLLEHTYKSIGLNVEFDRNDLKLYLINKRKKIEVIREEVKKNLINLSLEITNEYIERIINNDKCSTI